MTGQIHDLTARPVPTDASPVVPTPQQRYLRTMQNSTRRNGHEESRDRHFFILRLRHALGLTRRRYRWVSRRPPARSEHPEKGRGGIAVLLAASRGAGRGGAAGRGSTRRTGETSWRMRTARLGDHHHRTRQATSRLPASSFGAYTTDHRPGRAPRTAAAG